MENFDLLYTNALTERCAVLDKEVCPKLKALFGQIHLFYQNYYKILLNKGVIKPDQYREDQKITTIMAPSVEPFPESNRTNQMSIRLSELDAQYDYLYMFLDLNTNGLSIKILKGITEVLRYIEWDKINLSTEHYMTQSLALVSSEIRTDGVSDKLMNDVSKQLASLTRLALGYIKELSVYHREYYKAQLIQLCFGSIKYDTKIAHPKALELFINDLRRIVSRIDGLAFYRELATEAIEQIYGANADALQQQALENLKTVEEVKVVVPKKKVEVKKNYKEPLFLAFFELGRCAATLESIATKLQNNHNLHLKYGLPFGEKVLLILKRFVGGGDNIIYKTSFVDSASGQTFREEIKFSSFMDKLQERIKFLAKFADNKSPAYKKLNEASDTQADEMLAKQMSETRMLLTQCAALDDYFKKHVSNQTKDQTKGLKIELSSVKRQLARALELRHEYDAEKEASDGLKNLGL